MLRFMGSQRVGHDSVTELKDDQSSNTRKLGYVPYRQWCQYTISLEDKDSTEQTKSDDLRYAGLHPMDSLKSHL